MRKWLYIFVLACLLVGCKEYQVSNDPSLRLSFSCDTLSFDTVFTQQGSATMQVMVYNDNKNAVVIDRVWVDGSFFHVNVDGEADLSQVTRLQVNGGDSIYVFVRVEIDPTKANNPVLIRENLHFHLSSGIDQQLVCEAYGQDVTRIRSKNGRSEYAKYRFTNTKPYLLFDTVIIGQLTLEAGARLYMHKGASLYALGDVQSKGTKENPVVIQPDRLDNLFDSVPYRFAAGGWNGIYLQATDSQNYNLQYTDILSGNIGLYCMSDRKDKLPRLTMNGCRIHNHAVYGLVLQNVHATVINSEISNCASYCVYCQGGTHDFIHTTIASYYGETNIRIQGTGKENVAAVYVHNLSKETPETVTSFYNSIVTGPREKEMVLATPFEQYYPGTIQGSWIGQDTANNVFRNTFYKYKEYVYYDFRLDSLSPARGIGDSGTAAKYPKDREGIARTGEGIKPDAGCYQYQP